MRSIRTIAITSLVATLITAAPSLAQGPAARTPASASAATPAGKWTITMETPHGTMTMGLDLKLDGATVTGTYNTDMTGTVPTSGTFKDGKVTLKVDAGQGRTFDFHFTFKDKDTMTGNISSEMGDMACTAMRPKEKGAPSV